MPFLLIFLDSTLLQPSSTICIDCEGLVSCCDWHPRIDKLAVALKDDTIKIFYDKGNTLIPLLKHKRQVGINVVGWKPLVDDTLAVGCHDCCILWTIDPASLSARPGSGQGGNSFFGVEERRTKLVFTPKTQAVHKS